MRGAKGDHTAAQPERLTQGVSCPPIGSWSASAGRPTPTPTFACVRRTLSVVAASGARRGQGPQRERLTPSLGRPLGGRHHQRRRPTREPAVMMRWNHSQTPVASSSTPLTVAGPGWAAGIPRRTQQVVRTPDTPPPHRPTRMDPTGRPAASFPVSAGSMPGERVRRRLAGPSTMRRWPGTGPLRVAQLLTAGMPLFQKCPCHL